VTFAKDAALGSYEAPIELSTGTGGAVSSPPSSSLSPPPSALPLPPPSAYPSPPSSSPSPPPSALPSPPPSASGGLPSALPPSVVAQFSDSMSIIAVVLVGGAVQDAGLLGAYVGDELRGVTGPLSFKIPPLPGWQYGGETAFSFLVYGTDGESFTFTYQDASGAQSLVTSASAVTFAKDAALGSYEAPMELTKG